MDDIVNEIIETQQDKNKEEPNCPNTPKQKPLFELTKRDNIFATLVLIAGIFISIFGIFGGFAFGYMISNALIVLSFIIYFINNRNIHFFPMLCMLLALGNSAVFITTTNGSVKFFGVVISFMLSVVGAYYFSQGKTSGNRATLGIFYSAVASVGNVGVSLKSLLSNKDGNKKSIGKVAIGLLCAVPVLIIIVPLLIKSDDAFSGLINSIFDKSGNPVALGLKVVFGAIISLLIISYGFSLKTNRIAFAKEAKTRSVDNVCIISFLSAIAACYILYLFSQLAYFFSAFNGFLPNQDITYSQYARKGFFEMCTIAVINLVLVFLSILLAKKQEGKACVTVRIIATFICLFTLIIIATAISKMVLYINEYGMTILRVTTSAFMLFLAIGFIAVILRIYINNINIVKTMLATAGIIILLLGTLNVNGVCARYNYNAYKQGKLEIIDVEAMYDLGDEGVPYLIKLAASKNTVVANKAKNCLVKAYMDDYFDNMHFANDFSIEQLKEHQKYKSFSYFSLPKSRAYNMLYKFIEKNPQFSSYCLKNHTNTYDLW